MRPETRWAARVTGVELGVDDVVGADASQDATVGAEMALAQIWGVSRSTRLPVMRTEASREVATPTDRRAELGGAQLLEGLHVRGVGLHQGGCGRSTGARSRDCLDGQDLSPEPVKGGGDGGAEASQPDDERGVGARGRGGHEVS